MNKVYIVRCSDYNDVSDKLGELISSMGGIDRFVQPGEKVVLKVNLLQAAKPEQAVTTHPKIVSAMAAMIRKTGAVPVIADSPGGGSIYNEKTLRSVYEACEMTKAAEQGGAELNFDITTRPVSNPKGKLIRNFDVITPVINADAVFNLCKLKTHVYMSMTGAVKNNFGVIPGFAKSGFHLNLADPMRFADMLLDLAECVSPRISIMDAVIGLEGDGPGAPGTPRAVGLLLASVNPLALDTVAAEIIGLRMEDNPVLLAAEKRGLMPGKPSDVRIIGPNISELRIPDYKFPRTIHGGTGYGKIPAWQKIYRHIIRRGLSRTPYVIKDKCINCGICRDSCPPKAITIKGIRRKHAGIDAKKCIRCYCCHELCPQKAIELKKGYLYK